MASALHETLVDLFRSRPTLAAELLQRELRVPLPDYTRAEIREADLTQIVPAEHRADLLVLLQDDQPVFAIVLEAQLRRDADKRWSWPLYATSAGARWRCQACVLVIAPDAGVARWAEEPIVLGPGNTYHVWVLGSSSVPRVTDPAEASRTPELSVLSSLAHGNEAGGEEVVIATYAAATALDPERARMYIDVVLARLNEAARNALEALMASGGYEYQSEFARKYYGAGKAEGKREALLRVLELRRIPPSPEHRALVGTCTDLVQLDAWLAAALSASTAAEVFAL